MAEIIISVKNIYHTYADTQAYLYVDDTQIHKSVTIILVLIAALEVMSYCVMYKH